MCGIPGKTVSADFCFRREIFKLHYACIAKILQKIAFFCKFLLHNLPFQYFDILWWWITREIAVPPDSWKLNTKLGPFLHLKLLPNEIWMHAMRQTEAKKDIAFWRKIPPKRQKSAEKQCQMKTCANPHNVTVTVDSFVIGEKTGRIIVQPCTIITTAQAHAA